MRRKTYAEGVDGALDGPVVGGEDVDREVGVDVGGCSCLEFGAREWSG